MGIAELLLVGVSLGISVPLIFILFMPSSGADYLSASELARNTSDSVASDTAN